MAENKVWVREAVVVELSAFPLMEVTNQPRAMFEVILLFVRVEEMVGRATRMATAVPPSILAPAASTKPTLRPSRQSARDCLDRSQDR